MKIDKESGIQPIYKLSKKLIQEAVRLKDSEHQRWKATNI